MTGSAAAVPTRTRVRAGVGALVGLLAGVVALGPALKPGFLLFYDMVFVPRLGLTPRTLGTDGSVPRAVPNDLVVALASQVLPGWVVQKLILLGGFVIVGAGVGALSRTRRAAAGAAVVAAWNPWMAERLAIGHWGFTLGYAVLPWVLYAALRARDGSPRGRSGLLVALVAVALTGSTASVAALPLVAAALLLPKRAHRWLSTLGWAAGTWLCANAAWWFPFLALAPAERADPAGVAAFAARADTPLGVLASVLTGGGIWNRGNWFDERSNLIVATVALLCVAGSVAIALSSRPRPASLIPAAAVGTLGYLVAIFSAVPGGSAVITHIVTDVPGGGLLRDSQKFAALWMLFVALSAGVVVERLTSWLAARGASRSARVLIAAALALWPVATLPSMAGGALGKWQATAYPQSFLNAADEITRTGGGATAIFPWSLYRRYEWNGNRVVLDPWQRLIDGPVLVNDDLPLSDRVVRGESRDSARIRSANERGENLTPVLQGLGVRWVIVQTDQPSGGLPRPVFKDARVVSEDPELQVLDLGPTAVTSADARRIEQTPAWKRGLGLMALMVAIVGSLGYSAVTWLRDRRRELLPETRGHSRERG